MKKEQKEQTNKYYQYKNNKIKMENRKVKNLRMKNKKLAKYQIIVINNKYKNQKQLLNHYGPHLSISKNGKKLCFQQILKHVSLILIIKQCPIEIN